jgi:hypothetical protein
MIGKVEPIPKIGTFNGLHEGRLRPVDMSDGKKVALAYYLELQTIY